MVVGVHGGVQRAQDAGWRSLRAVVDFGEIGDGIVRNGAVGAEILPPAVCAGS